MITQAMGAPAVVILGASRVELLHTARRIERKDITMKTFISAMALSALAGTAMAAPDFTDSARVVSSTPIVERVYEPRTECEPVPAAPAPVPARERSVLGPIVGGVAGALLGSTIGKGNGRNVATAAGAVVGTIVGDRVANPGSDRPMTGAVIGGAAGGLAGAQVGGGNGKTAATAAGAIAGSMIGDRVQNRQTAMAAAPAEDCRTVESARDVIRGYAVVYRYNGHDVTTTLPYDPGSTVRVGVSLLEDSAPMAEEVEPRRRVVRHRLPPRSVPISHNGGYVYRY
jgi:uncharacterized protein YcfJ